MWIRKSADSCSPREIKIFRFDVRSMWFWFARNPPWGAEQRPLPQNLQRWLGSDRKKHLCLCGQLLGRHLPLVRGPGDFGSRKILDMPWYDVPFLHSSFVML